MGDEEIRAILIEITLEIAKKYEDSDKMYQRILNAVRKNE